jgi:murein DD-endopeptidase MepM/ murein hydrolase activator NlpD
MMKKYFRIFIILTFFSFFANNLLVCEETLSFDKNIESKGFPNIESLSTKNALFLQYCESVQLNYCNIAANKEPLIQIYTYTAKSTDDLLSVAARCSIPYESVATLNHIAFIDDNIVGKLLYLATCPGIFIPKNPKTVLDSILNDSTFENSNDTCYTINNEEFVFHPNVRLDSTQRAFFTDSGICPPLKEGVLTSPYGYRNSPITGIWELHQGIDIAVPEGTQVFACKSGMVMGTGCSRVYGNYIMLKHDGDITSLYAHLSKIIVKKGTMITGGEVIGLVGSTGLSTGPHLHFEIRAGGYSENPEEFSSRFRY